MLRWCQSTVRALDGGGSSTLSGIRFRSSTAMRGPTRVGWGDERTRATSRDRMIRGSGRTALQRIAYGGFESGRQLLVLGGQEDSGGRTAGDLRSSILVDSVKPLPNTSFPARGDPLLELTRILTPNTSSITPVPAWTLKKLYIMAKSQVQLHRLTSKQLTQLLSLMGSLSLPTPRAPCIYFNKLVSHIDESSFQTFWPFILEIARDKEELGWKLNGTDRYWIMRAQLAKVVVAEGEAMRSGDSRLHALSVATEQFLRIRRHTPDPEIHIPYLQVLFSIGSVKHVTTLVRHLCNLLESTPNPHSRFIDLLCHVLLKHGHSLSSDMKGHILSMVYTRVAKFGSVSVPCQKHRPLSSRKVFDDISKRFKRIALGVSDLRSALVMAVFPFSSNEQAPIDIQQWAHDQAMKTFAPHLSRETRWDNLILFAISRMPHIPVEGFMSVTKGGACMSGVSWKTVFVLATLHDTLATMNQKSLVEAQASIWDVVRSLWRMWKAENTGNTDVATSIIMASFYHAAANTVDVPLKQECFQYCRARGLFDVRDAGTASEKLQMQALVIAHILATVSCDGGSCAETFSTVAPMLTVATRDEIVELLLWYYIPRDVEDTLGLYLYSRRNNVNLSIDVTHAISISLASSCTLETAVPFLHHPQFSRKQVESLLGAILRVLQIKRRRRINSTLAGRIGQVMWNLYAQEPPANHLKYPIRFIFSILIASGHPAKAVSLVEAIHRQVPALFTTRLFLRIMRTLVRYRDFRLAARVYRLVPQTSSSASGNVRRKLTYTLDIAGLDTLARYVDKDGICHNGRRTPREALGRLISFRSRSSTKRQSISFRPTAMRKLSNGPAIKYAVSVLVGARRSLAAHKLFARSHHLLDATIKTSVGNIILHGPLLRSGLRNGRLVRRILRTKNVLEKTCAFVPDRVTINIILKAILRWKFVFDSPKIKALFDQIIRSGYPISSRWRRQHGVPFDTPISPSPQTFTLPSLHSAISFERHVRPMYKMFIKAFYLRHDIRAAKMVVGILKEEEALVNERREARDRARQGGLVEKQITAAGPGLADPR